MVCLGWGDRHRNGCSTPGQVCTAITDRARLYCVSIPQEIVMAIMFLHENRILHGDLKVGGFCGTGSACGGGARERERVQQ